MKSFFSTTLKASDWLKPILVWSVPVIVLVITSMYIGIINGKSVIVNIGAFLAVLVFFVWFIVFGVTIFRLLVNSVHYKGTAFHTDISMRVFVSTILIQTLLTVVTFGLYFPWARKKIFSTFAENITYNGKPFQFNGSAKKLFLLTLAFLGIYLLVGIVLSVLSAVLFPDLAGNERLRVLVITLQIVIWLLLVTWSAYYIRWFIDFSWGNSRIIAKLDLFSTATYMLGQLLLTVITIGIYSPLASVKIYRYIINRITVYEDDKKIANFGFSNLDGFKSWWLLFSQYMLIYLTLGIYAPWALVTIYKFFISYTYVEGRLFEDDVHEQKSIDAPQDAFSR